MRRLTQKRIILAGILGLSWVMTKGQQYTFVPFYQDTLLVIHNITSPNLPVNVNPESKEVNQLLDQLGTMPFIPLSNFFLEQQKKLALNDWLLFLLVNRFVETAFPDYTPNTQTVIQYYLLANMQYQVKLAYQADRIYIYAASQQNVYQTPFINIKADTYYNITYLSHKEKEDLLAVYLLPTNILIGKRPFSFYLEVYPNLKPKPATIPLTFQYGGEPVKTSLTADQNIQFILEDHPIFEESAYFIFPFSETLDLSIRPTIQKWLKNKSTVDKIKTLVAITRSGFRYKQDEEVFGCTKPLVAEAVFLYPFSDCEDRSALFFQLVKMFLDLPMIIIAYEDHITVGVSIPGMKGDFIEYNGLKYYICDPTGPINSNAIGVFPSGYRNRPYEILLSVNP